MKASIRTIAFTMAGAFALAGGVVAATFYELPDGTRVQWRTDSKSGGPTIEVAPGSGDPFKVHLG